MWDNFKGYLTVTCTGLTPGPMYSTPAGTLKADRYGKGMVKGLGSLQLHVDFRRV